MGLCFVLDEQLRGRFWRAVQRHNAIGVDSVDVVRVGDPLDLPCGTLDPDLLLWAAWQSRILVTMDWKTMPGHLLDLLKLGQHSPGILILRQGFTLADLVAALVLHAHAGDPLDYQDQVRFIP
jgi:hypothetical protein